MKIIKIIKNYVQLNKRNKMAQGTVKFFNEAKGFGFITPVDGGKDLFVHSTGLSMGTSYINEGDIVQYDQTEGQKGPQAANVSKV
jgi:cold shock protein